MKKNKLWSYALAAALAVSNLSVVAMPLTAYASAPATVVLNTSDGIITSAGTELSIVQGEVDNTFATTATKFAIATDGTTLDTSTNYNTTATLNGINVTSDNEKMKITATSSADTGTYYVAAWDGSSAISANKAVAEYITLIVTAASSASSVTYTATLDGTDWDTLDTNNVKLTPGKSYAFRFADSTGKDLTSTTTFTVTGPAKYANGILTVNSDAIENQTIEVKYALAGTQTKVAIGNPLKVGVKETQETKKVTLSLAPSTLDLTGTTAGDVLVGGRPTASSLPAGYEWGASTKAPTLKAFILSGTGLNDTITFSDNKATLTPLGVDKKSVVKVRYTFTGTAVDADTADETDLPDILYTGQIDQTVTVYPSASYKFSYTGTNEDKDALTPTFILKEEEGSVTITAKIEKAKSDIPDLTKLEYEWTPDNANAVKLTKNGASVKVTPRGTFVAGTTVNITLAITNDGGAIPWAANSGIPATGFDVTFSTNKKPSITANKTDVNEGDAVKFTIKDASGKTVDPEDGFDIYVDDIDPDNDSPISYDATNGYTFSGVGTHKVLVHDRYKNVASEVLNILVRSKDGVKATGINLDVDNVELDGETPATGITNYSVKATVLPDGSGTEGKLAEIATVTAKSNDVKVVTVDSVQPAQNTSVSTFTLTVVGPGETTVDFTSDDGHFKKSVKVVATGYKGIVVSSDKTEVGVGETITAKAEAQVYGNKYSKDVVWKSSDESIATVKDGVITGVAEGTAKIYATAKNDSTKKSNELTITVVDNTIPNAIKAAEAAAAAAVANPTDATIKAAQDAIAAAKKAGATDADLKAATDSLTKAVEAKKAADEAAKPAADGSAKDTPAPAGTELKDKDGKATGFKVTNATPGQATVEYTGPVDKNAKSAKIPATYTDLSGNVYKVTSIPANAFKGSKATTVTIGANITQIDPKAFANSKVKKVNVKGTKLTKKSAKFVNKMKKGSTVKVTGKNKKANKKLLNKQSAVKKGKVKVK